MKKRKRKWIYVMKPQNYEIACNLCGGFNLCWSEYEHFVWCHDCKKDTSGTGGIFDGSIPLEVCRILGISFDRFNLKTKKIMKMEIKTDKLIWR